MTRRQVLARSVAAAAATALALVTLRLTGILTIDWFPMLHTYGLTAACRANGRP